LEGLTLLERRQIEEEVGRQIDQLVRSHIFKGRFEDGDQWSLEVTDYQSDFTLDINHIQ
jgi:hypothetical protein